MGAGISRRSFLRTGAAAGVALNVSFLSSPAGARLVETPPRPGPDWIDPSGRPRYRLDALAKVTGAKTFARDYRAVDLPGWPREQSHAFFIHATKADRSFEGLDLAAFGEDLKPDRLVLHEDLVADGIVTPHPDFFGDVFLVPKGETPRLLGQPVALLGDFNIIPEEADVWSPKAVADDALFQPEPRAWYRAMLNRGWTDAVAALPPAGGHYTYWDYMNARFDRNHGMRIDHILLNPQGADLLRGIEIDRRPRAAEKASDHTPVIAEVAD